MRDVIDSPDRPATEALDECLDTIEAVLFEYGDPNRTESKGMRGYAEELFSIVERFLASKPAAKSLRG